jgi:hypothetical protein
LFTERPSLAPDGVDCNNPPANIVCTRFGNFNLRPNPGETLIPRNFGEGPGYFGVNLRISKIWSFGDMPSSDTANQGPDAQGPQAAPRGRRGGPGGGVPRVAGGGPGGGGRGGGRGGGGPFQIGAPGGAEAKRYTIQFSVNFSNLLNKVNLSNPEGRLSSPSFGESLSLGSSFGGFGGGGFGGGSGAGNRRVSAQIRFNF